MCSQQPIMNINDFFIFSTRCSCCWPIYFQQQQHIIFTSSVFPVSHFSHPGFLPLVNFFPCFPQVLQPISSERLGDEGGERRKLVNSRVISASLNQGRHIQLALPVQLTLRHLWLDNVSNPQCVFWDYTQE